MSERVLRDILADNRVISVDGSSNVVEATRVMMHTDAGAVLVTNGNKLEGIFTERDLVKRVVGAGLDPKATSVVDVMTGSIQTAHPDTSAIEALKTMQQNGFRHLPVQENNSLLGIVSLRDFIGKEMTEIQDQQAVERSIANRGS
jgi:CBS domain-containing protein